MKMRTRVNEDPSDVLRRTALAIVLFLIASVGAIAQTRARVSLAAKSSVAARTAPITFQDSGVADKWATVFGAKIHYLEAGSGPVVILLHGLGGSVSNWAPTIAPLAQKYRVIAPDQIGFGKSDKPMLNYRVGTLVDFLRLLQTAWNSESVTGRQFAGRVHRGGLRSRAPGEGR